MQEQPQILRLRSAKTRCSARDDKFVGGVRVKSKSNNNCKDKSRSFGSAEKRSARADNSSGRGEKAKTVWVRGFPGLRLET
jgi:hypothetical protein